MRTFFTAIVLFLTEASFSQALKDNFYIHTLQQELNRNVQRLQLPDLQKPFFIGYTLHDRKEFSMRAERGQMTNFVKTPVNRKIVQVNLLVGDYHRNFNYQIPAGNYVTLPAEDNADELKRVLWMETDKVYKSVAQIYNGMLTNLKSINVDEKDLELDDLAKITPIVKDFGAVPALEIDIPKLENMMRYLSSLFNNYPELTSSSCQLMIQNSDVYMVTSEGTIIRKPKQFVSFDVFAGTTDRKGATYSDSYSIITEEVHELPNQAELEKEIQKLISNVFALKASKKFDDYYLGPVLFQDEAVAQIVNELINNELYVRRKDLWRGGMQGKDYESKIGQKLVAAPISVIAIPSLKKFNEKKATGAYDIDYEGVRPPDSLILIKEGILKSLMNGRTPTPKFLSSQGFNESPAGLFYGPGVLKVTSNATIATDSLKHRLLKLAKEEGLVHAFILRKRSRFGGTWLYKVRVDTGEEELVNSCELANLNIRSLRRFIVASNQLYLTNVSDERSILAPKGIIINEVEIEKKDGWANLKPIVVSNPLLDKKTTSPEKKSKKNK